MSAKRYTSKHLENHMSTTQPGAPQEQRSRLLRSALGMSAITILSRVLGLVREALRAAFLGTGAASDAFGIAFQLPNLLRRFMGEGAMSAGFVPVFARVQQDQDSNAVRRLVYRSANVLLVIAGLTVLLGIFGAPWIIDFYVWLGSIGSTADPVDPQTHSLTVSLTRWMFPYLFFVSMAALAQGILNTYRIFWVSAFSAVLLNIAIIVGALALARGADPSTAAYVFAGAVVVGGVFQLFFQLPWIHRLGFRWRPSLRFRDPHLGEMGRLLLPATFSAGIYQINVLVSQAIAYTLPQGSVSSLQYSSRLLELTLGVFAVSVSTVILPRLSKEAGRGDKGAMRETLAYALRLIAFICLPATVGLLLLRSPIVSVLFERGAFDQESLSMTTTALLYHAPGLLFIALGRVLVPAFYALKDTRRPMIAAGASMIVNIVLCYALRNELRHGGIALANSVSAVVTAFILVFWLRSQLDGLGGSQWLKSATRSLFASALLVGVLWAIDNWLLDYESLHGFRGAPGLVLVVLACVVIYSGAVHLLGGSEPREFVNILRRRRARS